MSLELVDGEVLPERARRFGVPRLPAVHIGRPRLVDRLASSDHLPLRIVHGGYGYGKTTLLAEWARERGAGEGALFWVTVDEVSNGQLSLWRMVLGLLRAGELGERGAFGAIAVEPHTAEELPAARLEAFESLCAPITLVVDSYERLLGEVVQRDLLRLLRHTENLRLVIGTRSRPTIDALGSEYGIEPLVIDMNALRFDHDEVVMLAERLGVQITDAQASSLLTVSAGWPGAVREALMRERDQHESPDWTGAGAAYVNRCLMNALSKRSGFPLLLLTSIADSFTIEQAEFLGAEARHIGVLDEMETLGLGTWSSGSSPVFRVNPMVRGVLRREFAQTQRGAMAAAYRRLAQWLEQHGESMRAFEAAVRGEDWSCASRCLHRSLLGRGNLSRVRRILISVPVKKLQGEPLLMFLAGFELYVRGDSMRAVRYFFSVIALCEAHEISPVRRPRANDLWMQSIHVAALRLVGRYERVPRATKKLHRMLMSVEDLDGELFHSGDVIEAQLALTYLHLDRVNDAARALATTAPSEAQGRVSGGASRLVPLRALVQASRGFIHAARAELEQARAVSPLDPDSAHGVSAHLADALISIEEFDPVGAEVHLEQAQSHWASAEHWPLTVHALVRARWQSNDSQTALTVLREQRRQKAAQPPISPATMAMLDALEAELLLAIGRGSDARALLESGRNSNHPPSAVVRARALLLSDRLNQALSFADAQLRGDLALDDRAHLLLIAASAAERIGDRATALQRFENAAQSALDAGVRTPFAMMLRSDFLTLSGEYADLRALIEKQPEVFDDPGVTPQLTTRELVVLTELAGGFTLAEVAERLSVAVKTVKNQAGSLYRKLGVADRMSAVAVARRRGLL